jgi:Carboxypeptidase regulatory-like domain
MYRCNPGTTGFTVYFRLRDSTTGLPKLALTTSSGGASAGYVRARGSPVSIALVQLATPADAWTAGGFIEVSQSLHPGLYRFDTPDAVQASGVVEAFVSMVFTGVIAETILIRLEALSNIGTGSSQFTVSITDTLTNPLANARVWVTSDSTGTNVVAGTLTTGTNGQVTFFLNPGNYFLWVSDPGFSGTNPTTITVT